MTTTLEAIAGFFAGGQRSVCGMLIVCVCGFLDFLGALP